MVQERGVEKGLLVRKIEDGIVIDHIPPGKAFLVLKVLKIDPEARVVIASNVDSTKYGKKDIIKVEGRYLTSREIDLISLVAPTATINRVEDGEVKEKRRVKLPDFIVGFFKCPNLYCVTNAEYEPARAKFKVIKSDDVKKTVLQCTYCDSLLYFGSIIKLLESGVVSVEGLVSKEKIERTFLDVLLKRGGLKIAPSVDELFHLKSGRKSPYFINFGALTDGESLAKIKWAFSSYVALLLEEGELEDFDFVFGPSYKGINLAALTCEGLSELFGMRKRYMYDRKEVKSYGDKDAEKVIVGGGHFKPGQKILIIDDVITTGRTKMDSMRKLKVLGPHRIVGMILAVDRQEKMGGAEEVEDKSAVDFIQDKSGIKVFPILNIQTIFNLIKDSTDEKIKQYWIDYYEKYGVVKMQP
ncbi:MAG: aspartate carbamoyltransferase regulatory subunit [Candidatus Geothermarchaeales archaeon]